jgi:hypothetical protein|tara:strand:+ start:220 stop:879 length:660 start_codon:yes stop_codon:yes gene_type:complete
LNKNPFPRSYKYDELIKMYSDIAINGSYKKDGTIFPPSQVFGMSGQVKFKKILKTLFTKYNIKSVLDYGAGQGSWENKVDNNQSLKNYLNLDIVNYFEPARKLDTKTISECVVSFDVLEHVFISDIPWVIYDIFSYSSNLVIINAACYPAGKLLPNKENVHITVRQPFWWKGIIDGVANFFPNINYVVLASKTPKDVTIYEDVSREEYLNVKGYMALNK